MRRLLGWLHRRLWRSCDGECACFEAGVQAAFDNPPERDYD